jgi:hypothetical protein
MPTLAPHAHSTEGNTQQLRSLSLPGPAGKLEALLNAGKPQATCAALICHPHPLGGGSLHNKVVYHAMKALNDAHFGFAWPVLRFNFRGMGLSTGEHHGSEEAEDVLAALDWLRAEYRLPILLAGFSFGAVMSIEALAKSAPADIFGLCALGLPVRAESRHYSYPALKNLKLPKLFLSGDRDEYAPAQELRAIVDTAAEPKELKLIPETGHFFNSRLKEMQNALTDWLKSTASLPCNLMPANSSQERRARQ